jgi:hypothetical protein
MLALVAREVAGQAMPSSCLFMSLIKTKANAPSIIPCEYDFICNHRHVDKDAVVLLKVNSQVFSRDFPKLLRSLASSVSTYQDDQIHQS